MKNLFVEKKYFYDSRMIELNKNPVLETLWLRMWFGMYKMLQYYFEKRIANYPKPIDLPKSN